MRKTRILCLITALLFVLPLLCFTACKPELDSQKQSAQFVAKVTEIGETRLFVTVIDKGTSSLENGTPAYVSTDFEGYAAPAVGDYIIVEYDTMVQEIYPPIIPNVFTIIQCDAHGSPLK